MTTLREAAQQALEALESCDAAHPSDGGRQWYDDKLVEPAITALRAALADGDNVAPTEPVQEPYCYLYEYDDVFGLHREFYPRNYNGRKPDRTVPLFTAPQRKPLTDKDIGRITADFDARFSVAVGIARAIELAHGITP